jgi:hypothetical protein
VIGRKENKMRNEEYKVVRTLFLEGTLSEDDIIDMVAEGVVDEGIWDYVKGAGKVAGDVAKSGAKAASGAVKKGAEAVGGAVKKGAEAVGSAAKAAGEKAAAGAGKVAAAAKEKHADLVAQVSHQAAKSMEQTLAAQVQKMTPQLVKAFMRQGLDDSMATALAKDAIKRAMDSALKNIVGTGDKVAAGL